MPEREGVRTLTNKSRAAQVAEILAVSGPVEQSAPNRAQRRATQRAIVRAMRKTGTWPGRK